MAPLTAARRLAGAILAAAWLAAAGAADPARAAPSQERERLESTRQDLQREQKDLKRILGYSSVAHAGYVIVGLVAGTPKGLAAAAFYSLVYVLMNLTCFWVICRVAVDGRNLEYKDLNGLHRRSPALAFILAVSVFSLVGLPPTAGFIGKLFLLTAAWNHGYNWLVIVASVNTAISIYYYLSFARHAYTQDAEAEEPLPVKRTSLVWGGVLAACVLLLGILPMSVFEWAYAAGRGLMP